MNFFSTDVFLHALAQARFANATWECALRNVGPHAYRLLIVDGEPISRWPYLDFVEPFGPAQAGQPNARFLPYASTERIACTRAAPPLPPQHQVAPTLDWSQFANWEAFEQHVIALRSSIWTDSARRERKMTKALGDLSFAFHDPSDDAFVACREWKSAQYIATGGTDAFFQANIGLFEHLRKSKSFVVSSLRASGKPVAVSWSNLSEGRLGYWVVAYDTAAAEYSPGRLLLHRMFEESFRRGHREFDFLIGNEPYKWHYATHTRIVGPVGSAPLSLRLANAFRQGAKTVLQRNPRALDFARRLKRSLQR
ncbi:MAG: GNAT family N-acetyltransferase [Myxococcaceae bacterium]